MSESTGILLLFGAVGVLFWALGRGMRGIGPNPWYGIRIGATFADRRVWDDANRRGGVVLARLGLGLIGAAVVSWALLPPPWQAAAMIAVTLLGTCWLAYDSITYANRRLAHYRALDATEE